MKTPEERALLALAVARMRSRIMALVCATLAGAALFAVTAIHVPRARRSSTLDVGLLENYLPGYSVSWTGALLALVYGAILGAVLGGVFGWIYNRLTVREA